MPSKWIATMEHIKYLLINHKTLNKCVFNLHLRALNKIIHKFQISAGNLRRTTIPMICSYNVDSSLHMGNMKRITITTFNPFLSRVHGWFLSGENMTTRHRIQTL